MAFINTTGNRGWNDNLEYFWLKLLAKRSTKTNRNPQKAYFVEKFGRLHDALEMIIWDIFSLPHSRTAEKRCNYSFQKFGLETGLCYKSAFLFLFLKCFNSFLSNYVI